MKSQKNKISCWINAVLSVVFLVLLTGGSGFFQNASGQGIPSVGTPTSNTLIHSLTEEERAWLREHPVIRVVQDSGWPPVEFADDQGEYRGMSADYLSLVEQRLGLRFKRERSLSWQESYVRLKRWEIDMTTSVAATPERHTFWAFTRPYMKIPIVIIARAEVTYIADMRELTGKKVAVVDGYAVNDWIPRDFPDIHLVKVKTVKEGLDRLQKGEVFTFVDNMLVVGYYLAKLKMTNLKIAGETPYVNAQCMAVRKDWAILAGILQKGLDSISETERNEIYKKWLPIRYEHGFNYNLLWQALAIFAVILLGLMVWIRKLSGEIRYRKKVEAALRENEIKFRFVFESANVGKSITLPTGEIDVNQAFADMLGYTLEEIRNKRWQDLTPPGEIETIQQWLDPLLEGEKNSARFNKRYVHKNGSYIWADVSVAIHRDVERKPLYFITTIIDITEHKRAEEILRYHEHLLQEMGRVAKIGGWEFDPVTGKGTWTEEVARIHDLDPDDGTNVEHGMSFYHGEARLKIEQALKEAIEHGKPYDLELEMITAKGAHKWVQTIGHPIFENGKVVQVRGSFQDVTQRKHSEENFRKSEELFRETFYRSGVGKAQVDPVSGRFLRVNPAFCRFIGYTEAELIEKTFTEITFPEDREQDENYFRSLLRRESPGFSWEKRYLRKDGSLVWGQVSVTVLFDQGDQAAIATVVIQDITERKRAEEEVREREKRYRALFENMTGGFVLYEVVQDDQGLPVDLVILAGNQGFEATTGLKMPEVLGRHLTRVLPGIVKDAADWIGTFGKVGLSGEPRQFEQGSELLGYYYSINAYQSAPKQCAVTFADITERKRAEKELRDAHGRIRRMIDANIVGIVIAKPSGEVIETNDYYLETIGYSREEFNKGLVDWRAITPPEWLPADEQAIKELQERGVCTPYEKEYVRRDGTRVSVFLSDVMLPGPEEQIAAFVLDITKGKRAEEELRLSEELFSKAFHVGPTGMTITRIADGKFINVNDSFCRLFEFNREEVIGHTSTELNMWTPEERKKLIRQQLESGGLDNFELLARSKSGKSINLLFSSKEMKVRGEPCHLTTMIDITERKRIKMEIQKLNEDLEQRVIERTAQLQAANRDLESFSYSVSHDLRAPLRAVSGFAQIVARRHRADLNEEGRHYVDNIVQASERMGQLIDDLLTYSRLGRTGVRHEPVPLPEVCDPLIGDLAAQLKEIGGTLSVAEDLPVVMGDRTLLGQIFSNLLENAVMYRKPDIPLQIMITWQIEGQKVFISVRDNGIGIAPEHHRKIFNLFQRLHSEEDYPGTGIGLATVKKSVELLGGSIGVESDEGEGSIFTITLPKE